MYQEKQNVKFIKCQTFSTGINGG